MYFFAYNIYTPDRKFEGNSTSFSGQMNGDFDSDFLIAKHTRQSLGELDAFLASHDFETPKRSPHTNIIDQRTGKTYCIPFSMSTLQPIAGNEYFAHYGSATAVPRTNNLFTDPTSSEQSMMDEFLTKLEACRLDGISLCFSERQYFSVPVESRSIKNLPYVDPKIHEPTYESAADLLYENDDEDSAETTILDTDIEDTFELPAEFLDSDAVSEPHKNQEIPDTAIEIIHSCIELDFDIYLREQTCFKEYSIMRLVDRTSQIIDKYINWGNYEPSLESADDGFFVAILRKPIRKISSQDSAYNKYGEVWKESFHIRFFIKVSKQFKQYLRKKLLADPDFGNIFGQYPMANPLEDAFDKNILANPIMFYGSTKRAGTGTHDLAKLYYVKLHPTLRTATSMERNDLATISRPAEPILDGAGRVRGMRHAETFCKYNLCKELSLLYEGTLIHKRTYEPRDEVAAEISTYAERTQDDLVSDDDFDQYEQQVTNITTQDFDARYLKQILDIIGRHRAINYDNWKTVIIALARRSREYKPLAVWFSMRYLPSFANDGMKQLDGLWQFALTRRPSADQDHTSVNTLYYWARLDNPREYDKLQQDNMLLKIRKTIFDQQGKLNDVQFAKILRDMFGAKFRCDSNRMSLEKKAMIWREFVTENDDQAPGQLFKWRKEGYLHTLHDYIANKLPLYLDHILQYCKSKIDTTKRVLPTTKTDAATTSHSAGDLERMQREQKYHELVAKGIATTKFSLGSVGKISMILKACESEFLRGNRGFEEKMDTDPVVIGVQNGVLRLRPKLHLIQGYHEIPISKSVNVPYIPYDPNNQYVRDLSRVFLEIFNNNVETMNFWMMLLASGLNDLPKTPQFFCIWHGSGSQGKSVINELDIHTLGLVRPGGEGGYANKMDIGWFCSDRKGHGPDAALASTKKVRRIWASETDVEATPRVAKIKEMTSDHVSGNDKNEKQDIWKVNAHIIVPTNNEMRILGRDYGTWRRILYFRFKRQFKRLDGLAGDRYDPNDPTHSIANQDIIDKWIHDPNYQAAYFSMLTHYHEMLYEMYGGDIRKVPKSEIDRETEEYFMRQDTLTQFVKERVIHIGRKHPDDTEVNLISIGDLMQKYIRWHSTLIGRDTTKFNHQELKQALLTHFKLEKYFINGIGGECLTQHIALEVGQTYVPQDVTGDESSPTLENIDNITFDDDMFDDIDVASE